MSEKDDAIRRLTANIATAARLRASAKASSRTSAARTALRNWQADRFSRTHADLLASAEYGDAARFFLTDLYGPADVTNRDALMQRVVPILSKMLSAPALEVIADAIELDSLSESLDADMVAGARRETRSSTRAPMPAPIARSGARTTALARLC